MPFQEKCVCGVSSMHTMAIRAFKILPMIRNLWDILSFVQQVLFQEVSFTVAHHETDISIHFQRR
jgi:hypothetical protein